MSAGHDRPPHADADGERTRESACTCAVSGGKEGLGLVPTTAGEVRRLVSRPLPPLVAWVLGHRHLLALAGGVTLLGLFALLPLDPEAFKRYGYVGVFVTTLIATGGLVLPMPYLLVVAAAGTVLNPLAVGLVAGLASAMGELTGYLVGFAGVPLIGRGRWYAAIERWVKRRGFWAILALSIVPNPLFDAAGIAAGTLAMPLREFWIACFCGKTLRLVAIAWLASLAPGVLERWLR
ncbi:MAG: VTT domain-containing protein [Chloroflexi bacterium]|nr:VTT domain-containing protein [Chloroflexota bacterium]